MPNLDKIKTKIGRQVMKASNRQEQKVWMDGGGGWG